MTDLSKLAASLSDPEKAALATLPLPRDANPVYMIAARPYSSTWRKSARHINALRNLEHMGMVERKTCRGETLWRLTKHLGWSIARAATQVPEIGE